MGALVIATTYRGVTVFVLPWEPDWRTTFRSGIEVLSSTDSGLTGRETRRPFANTLRMIAEFDLILTGAEATAFAAGMRAWTTEPVAVPFWPAAVFWEGRADAPLTSGTLFVFRPGGTQWALYASTDAEPGWATAGDIVVPVLLGRIERKDPVWMAPLTCKVGVEFREQSEAADALSVAAVEWSAGPAPSEAWTSAPVLFPFRIQFDQPTLGATVEVVRERIGFGRLPVETAYPQAPVRAGEAPFIETGLAIPQLIRFFADHAPGQPFWAPAWVGSATLSASASAGATTLNVEAGHDIKAGDWIVLSDATGEYQTRATAVTDTTLTVAALPFAQSRGTVVSHLLLVRFDRPRMTVEWASPQVARVRLALRELPAEYSPASVETLGTTLGKLPVLAYLYAVEEVTAGATVVHRFTSFERDLVVDGDTYTAARIDHGAVRQGIAMDRDEVEVRFSAPTDPNHPLVRLVTMRCESPLSITVRRVELSFTA